MCPSGATCLSADYKNPTQRVGLADIIIIISLKINVYSPWYSWKIAELVLNNNHSLIDKQNKTQI